MRHWNGFEDFDVSNFCKILLKFAIAFKFFWVFLSFSEYKLSLLANEIFQVLQMGYLI